MSMLFYLMGPGLLAATTWSPHAEPVAAPANVNAIRDQIDRALGTTMKPSVVGVWARPAGAPLGASFNRDLTPGLAVGKGFLAGAAVGGAMGLVCGDGGSGNDWCGGGDAGAAARMALRMGTFGAAGAAVMAVSRSALGRWIPAEAVDLAVAPIAAGLAARITFDRARDARRRTGRPPTSR